MVQVAQECSALENGFDFYWWCDELKSGTLAVIED